jgi:phosphoribosylformylglycinamidine synthase
MAGRAGNGVEIDVAKVPVREPGMTPYEILLSESQERMLVVAKKGSEGEVRRILEKWELEAAEIGRVTDDGLFRVTENGTVVAEIPALPLTTGCPTYEREGVESADVKELRARDFPETRSAGGDQTATFLELLGSPNLASKRWVYQQYDSTVRTSTAVEPGGDAGVVRIRGTRRAVAATTDCNGRYCYLSPREGAKIAVAQAARNLACVGAVPSAVTNNLNFGSPLRSQIYFQLRESVEGMAEACKAFETPVTGGNVSLYNETDGVAIYPTPVIGMVGVVEDVDHITKHAFRSAGDVIVLLGENTAEIGASEYLYVTQGVVAGTPPAVDLDAERALQGAVLAMIQAGQVHSAHDVAEGGLAAALAESALGAGEDLLGVDVGLEDAIPPVPLLFGEAQGRVLISCERAALAQVMRIADRFEVPAREIGVVTSAAQRFRIRTRDGGVDVDLDTLADAFFGALPKIMEGKAEVVEPVGA